MPYIKQEDRERLNDDISILADEITDDRMGRPGEMNYTVSKLIDLVYGDDMRYADYNEVLGFLEGIKLELYRRKVAPYEDIKLEENGDL